MFPHLTPEESFVKYQSMVTEAYDRISKEEDFITIDGTMSPREVQTKIRERIGDLLWKEDS